MPLTTLPGINILNGQSDRIVNGTYDEQEIVSLITEYYELLAKMRYFPKSCIKYPPHSPSVDLDVANNLNLEPQVIELLQALPYIEGHDNEDVFLLGGTFADMRDPEVLRQSRDPAFSDPEPGFDVENGEYVRPWELVLNVGGNNGSIMYLNTRNGHITMEDQDSGDSTDPAFNSEFQFSNTSRSINKNLHDHLFSRHAREVFDDFTSRLIQLKWIPSAESCMFLTEQNKEYDDLKWIFRTYGWPNDFNASGFDAAYQRWQEFENVCDKATTSARLILETFERKRNADEYFERLARRFNDGVWDRDPNKTYSETKKLKNELQYRKKVVENSNKIFERAKAEHGGWESEEKEIMKAWKNYLEGAIRHEQGKLDSTKEDNIQHEKEKEIQEQERKLATYRSRLEHLNDEPKTVEDAIKPRILDILL